MSDDNPIRHRPAASHHAGNSADAAAWNWLLQESIPNETDEGKRLLEMVIERLEANKWLQHDVFGVHLALEEAIVNAMKHGNRFDQDKQVHFTCKMSADRLIIEIADEGAGFDPNDVPDCTDPENLEVPSGRGIMLMRSFMSSVEFSSTGNRVILEKRRG